MPEPTVTISPAKEFVPPRTNQPKIIIPEQTKEPPKEVLNQTFTLDPSITIGEQGTTPLQAVAKEEKTVEKKEVEVEKKEVEVKVSPVVKPPVEERTEPQHNGKKLITPASAKVGEKKERDYSSFPQDQHTLLKQMSNEAFAQYERMFKEHTDLKKQNNDIFFQHPDAFTLSPEYSQLNRQINAVEQEASYWEQCLEKLDKGENIRALKGWNDKGQLLMADGELVGSKALEEKVRQNLYACTQRVNEDKAKLAGKQQNFQQQVTQDLQAINTERKQRFAWIADSKLMDHTITIAQDDGKEIDVPIKEVRQNIMSLFPPYMRNHVAVETVADMFVALNIQDAELRLAKNGQIVAEKKKEEIQRAEPTSELKPSEDKSKKIGGISRFSLEGMPA